MKNKLLCAILAIAVLSALFSCSGNYYGITLDKLYEANLTDTLVKSHGSVYAEIEYTESNINKWYADSEVYYDHSPVYEAVSADTFRYASTIGDYTLSKCIGGERMDNSWAASFVLFDGWIKYDKIQKCVKNEDTYTVTSIMTPENYKKVSGYLPEGLKEVETEYTVAMDDLRILSGKTVMRYENGNEESAVCRVEYGKERPAQIKDLLDRMNSTENTRTVKAVFDPDTDKETIEEFTAPKGDSVVLFMPQRYDVYEDRECTKIMDKADDMQNDMTLYLKASEESDK